MRVFFISMVMVMGPAPPGTGVMYDAFSITSGATSPQTLPSALRLMPTSMTTAPSFTMSGVMKPALPTAATRISARRQTSARFCVRLWQITQEWLDNNKEYFAKLVDVVRVRVKTLQEVVDAAEYFFKDVESYDEKGVAKHFKPEAAELLEACIEGIKALPEFNLETTEALYNKIAEEHGLSLGKAIHPTRLALTGRTVSPGLFDVMVLLGREKTLERMEKAVEFIKNM